MSVAIYAWYRHFGDYRQTLEAVIQCGGDTDTTGAIAGALAGATTGESGIPQEWIDGIRDCPINAALLREAAAQLAGQRGRLRFFGRFRSPETCFSCSLSWGMG